MIYNLTSIMNSSITKLNVSSVFEVDLQIQENQDNFLELDCPENMRDNIEISQKNGVLTVGLKNNVSLQTQSSLGVVLKTSSIEKINASGVSEIYGTCFVPSLKLELSGASAVKLKGAASKLDLSLSGTSTAKLFNFETQNLKAHISGASQAKLLATKTCSLDLSGASNATIKGNPQIQKNVSGVASLKISTESYEPCSVPPLTPVAASNSFSSTPSQEPDKKIAQVRLASKEEMSSTQNNDTPANEENNLSQSLAKTLRSLFRR